MKNTILLSFILLTCYISNAQTLIRDIKKGEESSMASNFNSSFELKGEYYFMAQTGSNSQVLSIFKKTIDSATLVVDTKHGASYSRQEWNDKIYYQASYTNTIGNTIHSFFEFDGSTEKEIILDPTDSSAQVSSIQVIDDKLYIQCRRVGSGYNTDLYEVNGTAVIKVVDNLPYSLHLHNDTLFYINKNKTNQTLGELYWVDIPNNNKNIVSSAGTTINKIIGSWNGELLAEVNGTAKSELWKINGTPRKIGDIGELMSSFASLPITTSNEFLFRGKNDMGLRCMYSYNGSTVEDITGHNTLENYIVGSNFDLEFYYSKSENMIYYQTRGSDNNLKRLYSLKIGSGNATLLDSGNLHYPMVMTDNDRLVYTVREPYSYNVIKSINDGAAKVITDTSNTDWRVLYNFSAMGNGIFFSGLNDKRDSSIGVEPYFHELATLTTGGIKMKIQNVKIYPNPTHNRLNIDLAAMDDIIIYNVQGLEVLTSKEKSVDISSLPKGLYFLSARDGAQRYSSKFIKN